jgi:hypothetical protein
MPTDSPDRSPRTSEEDALLEEVRRFARANLGMLEEAGMQLDEGYSLRGVRHRRALELKARRDLRTQRLEWCRQLRAACLPGEDRRLQRRNLPTTFRPGDYRRKLRGPDGFLWTRREPIGGEAGEPQRQARVISWPLARLKKAITEELQYVDRGMTVLQAKTVVLLCWLAHDRVAHEVAPATCEFQQLPWDAWSLVDGEEFQGRALCDDQLGAILRWVPAALAILRSVTDLAPKPAVQGQESPSTKASLNKAAQAMGLLVGLANGGQVPTLRQLARQVGVNHSTLSRNDEFMRVWKRLREQFEPSGRVRRGERDRDTGEITAPDDQEEA